MSEPITPEIEKTRMVPIRIEARCPSCGYRTLQSGWGLEGGYPIHRCTRGCGDFVLDRVYPYIDFEPVGDGTAE